MKGSTLPTDVSISQYFRVCGETHTYPPPPPPVRAHAVSLVKKPMSSCSITVVAAISGVRESYCIL